MTHADPRSALESIERALEEAAQRFAQAPGGLWLAGAAAIEAAHRLLPRLEPTEAARLEALLARAQRLRDQGEARASAHEIAALMEWITLARERAAHEDALGAAMQRAPGPLASRTDLEAAVEGLGAELASLSRDAGPAPSPRTEAAIASLRAQHPEAEADAPLDDAAIARGREALRALSGAASSGPVEWPLTPYPSSAAALALAALMAALAMASLVAVSLLTQPLLLGVATGASVVGGLVLVVALARRRSERSRRLQVLEAWRLRARILRKHDEARAQLAAWSEIGRVLGQLDAYRRSEGGVALEARDHRLPALAPWVRRMAGGLDDETARRFE